MMYDMTWLYIYIYISCSITLWYNFIVCSTCMGTAFSGQTPHPSPLVVTASSPRAGTWKLHATACDGKSLPVHCVMYYHRGHGSLSKLSLANSDKLRVSLLWRGRQVKTREKVPYFNIFQSSQERCHTWMIPELTRWVDEFYLLVYFMLPPGHEMGSAVTYTLDTLADWFSTVVCEASWFLVSSNIFQPKTHVSWKMKVVWRDGNSTHQIFVIQRDIMWYRNCWLLVDWSCQIVIY